MPRTATTSTNRYAARTVAPALAVVTALLLTLTACGDARYQYVSNRSLGSFLRLPTDWTVQDVTTASKDGRVEALPSGIRSVWRLAFTSGDSGSVDEQGLPTAVSGRVEVYEVSDYYREQYSISALRSTQTVAVSVDPVYPPDGVGSEQVELSAYEKVSIGGITGSRSVANLNAADDGDDPAWVTQDLTVLFDDATGKIYVLSMYCSGACYVTNQKTIDEVATSFSVRDGV